MTNLNNLEKQTFTLFGIYRGIVEDNNDPDGTGRVKIRVFGLHDDPETPVAVAQLPWATPALSLSWSGGFNLLNKDAPPGKDRYDPGPKSIVAGTNVTPASFNQPGIDVFATEKIDPFINACGTGGHFVTPKNGNWLFVFFDGGNPMHPVYFAMAPTGRDWKTQAEARDTDIEQKISQLQNFTSFFKKVEAQNVTIPPVETGEDWTNTALVDSQVGVPNINIEGIISEKPNKDIYSVTSPNGTTIVIDNRSGLERLYIIHKNTIEHIDESGNKKVYIGKSYNKVSQFNSVADSPDPSNYQIGVEGNHELFIVGDWNVHTAGDINLKSAGNIQIQSAKNVGISVNSGDVDLIMNKGNLNAKVNGNLNANIFENANIKVDKDCNLLINKNLKATVGGSTDIKSTGNMNLQTDGDFNLVVGGSIKTQSTEVNMTTPTMKVTGQMNIGGNTKVTGTVSATQDVVAGQVVYALTGMDCGGFLRNRGPADLGGPLIAHVLQVVGGLGSGTGRPAPTADQPTSVANPAIPAQKEPSSTENSNLEEKKKRQSLSA